MSIPVRASQTSRGTVTSRAAASSTATQPWLHQVVPYLLSQASAALMTGPGPFRPKGLLPMWGGALVLAVGASPLDAVATRRLIEEFVRSWAPPASRPATLDTLTSRELDVLGQIGAGLNNAEIARKLHLQESTVKTHVGHLLTKRGLRDRVQAVVFAYEHGIIRPGTGSR